VAGQLRRQAEELAGYHAEDNDTDRAMGAMRVDHLRAPIQAEELGYEQGLKDR
jgi:hypothetical protein